MKKLLIPFLSLAFLTTAVADIQSPPGDLGPSDKLGRGLANLLFAWTEIGATVVRDSDKSYTKALGSGPTRGFFRMLQRYGWGFYEVSTWAIPNFKGGYDYPYKFNNTIMNPQSGFSEFPPEIGFQSASNYSRLQRY